jgi:hypothetical protein
MRHLLALAGLLLALGSGCSRKAPNATPEGAVRELVIALRQVDGDPSRAKIAFELLSKETRDNLVTRAERYGAASGKRIAPEQMIAPASFLEHFEARELKATITGRYAVVRAAGLLDDERAEIPCVFEDGSWHVRIELPVLSPVEVRQRDDLPRPN